MAHILFDILLVGAVVYSAVRQKNIRRKIPSKDAAGARPFKRSTITRPEPAVKRRIKATVPATSLAGAQNSLGAQRYILDGDRRGGKRDRMAETLRMMSGPGICTPNATRLD